MSEEYHDDDKTQTHIILTGGTLVGHYRIIKKIGAGGMGEVYLAEDTKLNRQIALKFLPARFAADETIRIRFTREAQAVAALDHPNVVTVHEVGEYQSRPYFAMQYLAGKTLHEIMHGNELPVEQVVDYTIQICEGLGAAHRAKIVHRDIKPSNIIVDGGGRARLLDFGLAKAANEMQLTKTGAVLGTACYMSPEQGLGQETDHRCDIFSVGVLLYEMLTGRSPFKRDNFPATVYAIVNDVPEPVTRYGRNISDDYQRISEKAIAKRPADRYQDIGDLIADLKRLQTAPASSSAYDLQSGQAPRINSLAVLYLRNLGSPDDEFLCYGITEDLIVDLTRERTLRVAAMRSILEYKDSNDKLDVIADRLDVNLVLDGSIHKSDKAIRVSAQLIDVTDGTNLWAERWEESLENLPRIKQALASGINSALQVDTSDESSAQPVIQESINPQSYELYLRGKYTFDHKKNTTDVEVALGLYHQALTEEPKLLAARAGMAEILIHKGEYDRAHTELESALADARSHNLAADEASMLLLMASAYQKQSMWDNALSRAGQALDINRKQGNLAGEEEALGVLIGVHQRRANFDDALALFERVVEINRQLEDEIKVSDAFKNMGNVHFRKGEYLQARELYEKAISIARLRENILLEAKCTANIGLTHSNLGNLDEAITCHNTALSMYSQLGDRTGQAICFNNIALIHSARGSYRKSIETYEKAALIQDQLGNKADYALVLSNMARLFTILGEYEKSIEMLEEALGIAKELNYPFVVSVANDGLGYAYLRKGEVKKAKEIYTAALEVADKSNLRREMTLAHCHLSEVNYHNKDFAACHQHAKKASTTAQLLGDKIVLLRSAAYIAAMDIRDGNYDRGLNQLREVLADAEEFGDPRYIIEIQRLLGLSMKEYGVSRADHKKGCEILEDTLTIAKQREVMYEVQWISKLQQDDN